MKMEMLLYINSSVADPFKQDRIYDQFKGSLTTQADTILFPLHEAFKIDFSRFIHSFLHLCFIIQEFHVEYKRRIFEEYYVYFLASPDFNMKGHNLSFWFTWSIVMSIDGSSFYHTIGKSTENKR